MGRSLHFGVVSDFDEARGLGIVSEEGSSADSTATDDTTASGSRATWSFHCTQIADGTRTIKVGAKVAFCVVPGHLGRTEAVEVTKI